jgi:carbon-monoxide dehydrogenase iron sulfur subunit
MSEKGVAHVSRMYVASDPINCGGCRRCQLACSLFHFGECNLELASIHVTKHVFSGEYQVKTCRQCKEPRCLPACPIQAIYFDDKTGALVIDEKNCTGCRMCEEECPFDMIGYNPEMNINFKCDLCGGDPQCVNICSYTAVRLIERRGD